MYVFIRVGACLFGHLSAYPQCSQVYVSWGNCYAGLTLANLVTCVQDPRVAKMFVVIHIYALVVILVACVKYQLLPIYVWSYTCPCGNFSHICEVFTVAKMCVVIHVPMWSSNIPSLTAQYFVGQQCIVQTDAAVQSLSSCNPELENTSRLCLRM